jgi:carbon storage regulator
LGIQRKWWPVLHLSRKVGESVVIQGDIEITVLEIRGQTVRLGCRFPGHVQVLRREVFDRIAAQNREAAEARAQVCGPRQEDGTPPSGKQSR